MSSQGELMQALAPAAGKTVLELATALLRFCREHREKLRQELEEDVAQGRLPRIRKLAGELFQEHVRGHLIVQEDLDRLSRIVRGSEAPAPLCARAFADALDEKLGHKIAGRFRGTRGKILGPNDPFPVVKLADFGGGLTPRRESLGEGLDEMQHLGLVPLDCKFEISLVCYDAPLASVGPRSLVAVGLPVEHLDLDHEQSDLIWKRYERGEGSYFFDVRPRDEARHTSIIEQLLEVAIRKRAAVLVLPELSVGLEALERLRQRYAARGERLPVLVAGSVHVTDRGQQHNRAVTLLPNGIELLHDKVERFWFEDLATDDPSSLVTRHEDVVHPRTLTLHVGETWSMMTVICKDLLPEENARLLACLRPRMLLVPAMSPKTSPFSAAEFVQTHGQAIVVVANTAGADAPGDPESAILARPLERAPVVSTRRRKLTPPALLTARLMATKGFKQTNVKHSQQSD